MPTISNEIMMPGTYQTYKNARPQLLSNGWILAAVYAPSVSVLRFRIKKTPTSEWEPLAFMTTSNVLSWSLAIKGTRVFATLHTSSSSATSFLNFDALTVNSTVSLSAVSIDNSSNSGQFNGEDLQINDTGTELHHAFSAKTPTYANTFNIRYLKGTIAGDGSVTWTTAEFVTSHNQSGRIGCIQPVIVMYNNEPRIICVFDNSGFSQNDIQFAYRVGNNWNGMSPKYLIFNNSRPQLAPDAKFIPKSINGLSNGRIWATWHGKDATDTAKFNIFTVFSDDGGDTWSVPLKQTNGNLYDQTNASLTADKTGKVMLLWDKVENPAGTNVTVTGIKSYVGSSWGAASSINGDDYFNPAVLFDRSFSLFMTLPPLIRYYGSNAYFSGTYFTGSSTSPVSDALGNKETPTITSYTVTPEENSTITQIVEKLNGTTLNTFNNPASLSRTLVIPQANWDALAFWFVNTIEVIVTDSNGTTITTTYTFNKKLKTTAGLIETTKATADAKKRISQKRETIATQVGLPAGSTFDAIIAATLSGTIMKVSRGSFNSLNSGILQSVTNLAFRPKIVIIFCAPPATPVANTGTFLYFITEDSQLIGNSAIQNLSLGISKGDNGYTSSNNADRSINQVGTPGQYDGRILETGFEFVPFFNSGVTPANYIALA
ncbi:sialidase family protein [Exiguobacterium sp. s181]|uniref:sialidase family protein n=1 Tax=Exiguobacterium sp. s181 TaxID=2751288 RepID=UPI001BE94593|nr:sialidase family protein [Exiguobacterium sp. s181]